MDLEFCFIKILGRILRKETVLGGLHPIRVSGTRVASWTVSHRAR